MKRFYWLVAAVLAGGLVWIWFGSKAGGQGVEWVAETTVPETKADSTFPGYVMGSDSARSKSAEVSACGACGSRSRKTLAQNLSKPGQVTQLLAQRFLASEVNTAERPGAM